MPLPNNGLSWPPITGQTEAMAEWSAWYSGDPRALSTFYGARAGVATHPNQFRGGVAGRIARWWWGQPTPAGESSAKLHVPLAADICGTSADLLFSESVKLHADSESMQAFLDELQDGPLDSRLHEGAEVQAALGGVYLRAVWDTDVSPMPWTDVAHPDGALPEFRHGRLKAVTLWSELPSDDTTVWRLLERHEPGVILYGLYEGTPSNLGAVRPLAGHPDSADLSAVVDSEGAQYTGANGLAVTYVPNMLPNRVHRHSDQGRSDLQGVEPFLDALDEAYSSWWRDIRMAKSRLFAPATMLESDGPGAGARLDLERELYVPLEGMLAGKDRTTSDLIYAQQFDIRVEQHKATCEAWTQTIIESAGYSTQSLSSGSGGAVTAAEVHSHERRSYMTRGKKVRYWTAALQEHLITLAEIANANLSAGILMDGVQVTFEDGVQESALSLAQTALALRNAEAASAQTRVELVHPDWDQEAVDQEVSRILSETGGGGATMPDPQELADAGL